MLPARDYPDSLQPSQCPGPGGSLAADRRSPPDISSQVGRDFQLSQHGSWRRGGEGKHGTQRLRVQARGQTLAAPLNSYSALLTMLKT